MSFLLSFLRVFAAIPFGAHRTPRVALPFWPLRKISCFGGPSRTHGFAVQACCPLTRARRTSAFHREEHEVHEGGSFVAANWCLRHFFGPVGLSVDAKAGCERQFAATTGPVRFVSFVVNELVHDHSARNVCGSSCYGTTTR
jgi:hypothetical protein